MTQLIPHLLLRTESHAVCDVAIALRDADYLVSKVDDEQAVMLATAPHVDGLIIKLPLLQAVAFARRFVAACGYTTPILLISNAPEVVKRAVRGVVTLLPGESSDLVSAVDLMLARHEARIREEIVRVRARRVLPAVEESSVVLYRSA